MPNEAPYKIKKDGTKFKVVNNAGMTKSTFKTRAEALKYLAALYANVPGASKKADRTKWTGKAKPAKAGLDSEVMERLKLHYQLAVISPADPNPAGYDAESEVIKRNADTNEAKQPHQFQAAIYLATPESPRRCLLCGCDEPDNNICSGLAPDAVPAVAPTGPKSVQMSKLSDDEAGEAARGIDAIVDQAVELLEGAGVLPTDAAQALALLQGADGTLDDLLEYFGVTDPDDDDNETARQKSYVTSVQERTPQPTLAKPAWVPDSGGFVTEVNNKTLITARATVDPALFEKAYTPNEHYLWTQGRLVGADEANRNGAFWTSGDLELGQTTVRHGPLNWLHDGRHVIGTLAEGAFTSPAPGEKADDGSFAQPHIAVVAPVWKWIYPDEASVIEMASDAGKFWYSMECISKSVQCVGDNGCGTELGYMDYIQGKGVCQHMAERSAVRRFVDPTFLGAAVIVPPVRPGWADANASAMTQAAALAEKAYESAGRPDVAASDWEQLMAQVVKFATA